MNHASLPPKPRGWFHMRSNLPVFPLGRKGHTDESAPGWKSLANRSGMQFRSGAARSERPRRCIRGGAMSVLLSGFPFRRLSILMAFRKTVSGSRGSGSNFNSLVSFTWWGNILAWGWKSFEDTLQMCNGWTNRTTSSSAFSTYVGKLFEMQISQNLIIWYNNSGNFRSTLQCFSVQCRKCIPFTCPISTTFDDSDSRKFF